MGKIHHSPFIISHKLKKLWVYQALYTEHSIWRYKPKSSSDSNGVQIDLLFDRNDRCINLIEIKFSVKEFTIDKKYADELQQKRWVFMDITKTKKSVFTTMLTTFGVKTNEHYLGQVQNQIKMGLYLKSFKGDTEGYYPT